LVQNVAVLPRIRIDPKRLGIVLGLLVALLSFWVYQRTRFGPFLDPKFALLTSESLLERGSWDLSPYLPGAAGGKDGPDAPRRWPYQLVPREGRLLYLYPPGTPLLTVPLAVVVRTAGFSALDANGGYSTGDEMRAQRLLASAITALTVGLIFAFARRELPPFEALVVALAAGLGTTLWTTASRALWTHTWTVALGAAAMLEAQRWESQRKPRPLWLGALLVALFWVRPTNAVAALGFTAFVALRHRAHLRRLLLVGALGLVAYVSWSLVTWGAPAPVYLENTGGLGQARSLSRNLFRDLLSTDRGLLVSSPIVIALLWGLGRRGVPRSRRALAALAGGVALGIWTIYLTGPFKLSGTPGPRFLTDTIPYLAALGALVWRGRLEAEARTPVPRWRRAAATGLVLLAVAAGVAAQAEWSDQRLRGGGRRARAEQWRQGPPTTAEELAAWDWRGLPQTRFVRDLSAGD
jgi:hypothetical protein